MKAHLFPVVPFAFYAYTCSRTIGASDTAILVDEMRTLNLSTHVNHHNLTILAGWLFSFAPHPDAAYVANLVSVFLGGVAVSAFYWLVFEATARRAVAAASALLLMVSHSMWWHSTIAEVYAANAVLTVVFLILLQRAARSGGREIGPLFFVAGLSIFNHAQMGVLILGACAYLAAVLVERRRAQPPLPAARLVLRSAAWLGAGVLPWAIVFAKDVARERSVWRAADLALGGDFKTYMMKGDLVPSFLDLLFLVGLQFPSPFLVLVVLGAARLPGRWRDRKALLALATVFAVNTGFFMFYDTWDKFAFLLPSFLVLAFCGAIGVDMLVTALSSRPRALAYAAAAVLAVSAAVPIHVYARLGGWAREPGFLHRKFGNPTTANTHDVGEYVANPNKRHFREYEVFVTRLFDRLPPGAVFVDDDSRFYYPILYYQRYEGRRRDLQVELVNVWGFEGWGLGQEAFARLLDLGHRGVRRVFLVSIGRPFGPKIVASPGSEHYRFRKLPLGGGRWVYEMLDPATAARTPVEPPRFTGIAVGQGFDTPAAGRERTLFATGERVMASVRFEFNLEPFPLRFRWTGPGGITVEGETLSIPFGCADAWAALDLPPPLPAGRWTVEATSGTVVAGRAAFEVR